MARAPAAPASRDRAPSAPAKAPLIQSAGNQQVLSAFGARAPLGVPVGALGDPLEREADVVAARVVQDAPLPAIRKAGVAVQRKCTSCGAPMSAAPRLPGAGEPLSAATRDYFEPRFGRDFSDVRVHRYPAAAEGSRQISAHAFTLGRDIAFAPGEFAPGTAGGQRLLAHELTHVVQQEGGQPRLQADGGLTEDDLRVIRKWLEAGSSAVGVPSSQIPWPTAREARDLRFRIGQATGVDLLQPFGVPPVRQDYSDICPNCHQTPAEQRAERARLRAEQEARQRKEQREAAWPGMHQAQHDEELAGQATTLAEDIENSKTSLAQLRLDLFDRALKARAGAGKAPSDSQINQEMRERWAEAEQATIVLESMFTATADEPGAEISDRIRGAYAGYFRSLQRLFAHRDFTERRAQIFTERMRRQQTSCPTGSCHQPARAQPWLSGLDLSPQLSAPGLLPRFAPLAQPARLSQDEELDVLAALAGPDKGPRGSRLAQSRERNEAAVARAAWKEVMTDYRWATAIVDEQLRAELGSDEQARESLEQFQYAQELLERQRTFQRDDPDALKVRAIFYPKNEFTEKTDDKGAKTEAAKGIPWQFYLTRTDWDDAVYVPTGYEWQLHDITAPVRADRTVKQRYQISMIEALARDQNRPLTRDPAPINKTDPPRSLYEELNHKDFFPEGELYWISPITGKPDHITTTASWTFGDWLKAIGMTIAILGSILFPPAAAAMMAIGTTLSIAGTLHRLHEQSEHGVLTDADIRGAVWDVAVDLASIATLGLGKIAVIGKAAGALRLAQGATRAYVFMKGVSLGMDVINLGLATRDFIVQWQAIQSSNMTDEQKRAGLAKLVTFSMLTATFMVVSARGNWKDLRKPGAGLHLDADEQGKFLVTPEPGADAAGHVKTRGTEKATIVDRTSFTHPDTGEKHSFALWSDGRITRCSETPCLTIAESVLTRLDEVRQRMPKGSAGHATLESLAERAKALREEAENLAAGSSKQLAAGTEAVLAKARAIEGDMAALEKKLAKETGWGGRVGPAQAAKIVPGGSAGGLVTGAERASGRTGAPLDWPIVKIDPKKPPDVVPDGVVLELPGGERVWRSAGENRAIVIEANIGPGTRRKDFEAAYYSRGEMEVPGYVKSDLERAHSQGAGTGFEAQYAIPYAPREVNQELQNLGIEEMVRELQQNRVPGVEYKLVTATSMQSGTRRLSLIEYSIVGVSSKGRATLFTTGIRVEGSLEAPRVSIAADLTAVHPEAAGLLPLNDLAEGLLQRRLDMFARKAAAKAR